MKNILFKSKGFLSGVFISSLGSTSFIIALLSFPIINGISPIVVGLAIGTSRIVGVITNIIIGPLGDKLNPKKIILFGEIGASISSILIFLSYQSLTNINYKYFIIAIGIRSVFTSAQSASIHKTAKNFDDKLNTSGLFAKNLNKATFGSIFFAMILNLLFIKYGNFNMVILFDAVSFIVNGIIMYKCIDTEKDMKFFKKIDFNPASSIKKNLMYFKISKPIIQKDILLATVMMGANTLNVILLGTNPKLIPLASGIFGLSVWLSGYLDKFLKEKQSVLWLILGLSLLAQGVFISNPYVVLAFSLIRNTSYWIIFNNISSEIMRMTDKKVFASTSAGRQTVINLIGALGEFWVGAKYIKIYWELFWRTSMIFLFQIVNFLKKSKSLTLMFMAITSFQNKAESNEIFLATKNSSFNLDPQTMEDVNSLFMNRQLYRGLFKYDSNLDLSRDLVASYKVLDSGKVYILTLGEHTFSDGTKITAKDVEKTFRRMVKIKSAIAEDLKSIKGFEDNSKSKNFGIKALSNKEVQIDLSFPDPFLLKILASVDCSILSLDENLVLKKIYSGNYFLNKSSKHAYSLVTRSKLNKNVPSTVNFIKVNSDEEAIALALNGKIDSLEGIDVNTETTEKLLSAGWKNYDNIVARLLLLSLNPNRIDLNIRKHINQVLIRNFRNPNENKYIRTFGLIPNLLPGAISSGELPYDENLNQPNKLRNLNLSYPDTKELEAIANQLKIILEQSNFKVTLVKFKFSDYFSLIKNKDYDIILRSKFLDFPDGMSLLTYFKYNIPINTFNAGSLEIDNLIISSQKEIDNTARVNFYKKIQIKLLENKTLVPLLTGSSQSFLWSGRVKNIQPHSMGFHSLYLNEIELNINEIDSK